MAENAKTLIEALAAAQGEITSPPKNKTVKVRTRGDSSYEFSYATLDSIIDHVRGPLTKNGLWFTQTIESDESGKYRLVTKLIHASGQEIASTTPLLVQGNGNQEFGSALTYMRRYALTALLGIAADEDDDGNAADGNQVTESASSAPGRPTAQAKRGNGKPAADPAAQQAKFFERQSLRIPVPTSKDGGSTDWQGWEGKMRKACDAAPGADAVNRLWQDNGDALGRLKEASAKGYDMLDRHFSERAAALSPNLAEAAA